MPHEVSLRCPIGDHREDVSALREICF